MSIMTLSQSTIVGLGFGLALIAYGFIFRSLELSYSSPFAWVFYLLIPLAAWLAQGSRVEAGSGAGELVVAGATAAVLASFVYALSVWGYNALVDDSLPQAVREDALQRIAASDIPAEAMERRRRLVEVQVRPDVFAFSVAIRMSVLGTVFALIFGYFRGRGA